jgi:hypothetical protein
MGKATKTQNAETCEDEYTFEVALPKPHVCHKHYWIMTTVYMSFLASFIFALTSYAIFAISAGSGIAALAGSPLLTAVLIALIQGIVAMAINARFGLLGGYFNPANMVAEYIFGDDFADIIHALLVFLASTVGYVVADLVLEGFYPQADLENGRVAFAAGTSLVVGFAAEFVGALVLALFVRAASRTSDASVSVWGAVTAAILIAFPVTGGGVNVHIYLGKLVSRSIISGSSAFFDGSEFVSYVFAPILAFVLAEYLHKMFVRERQIKYTGKDEEQQMFDYGQHMQ